MTLARRNDDVVEGEIVLPSQEEARAGLEAIRAFQAVAQRHLIKGHDYGIIPGTQRATLLKPGAEKIIKLMRLGDTYRILDAVQDWDRGLFAFTVACELRPFGRDFVAASGVGHCNSREDRYRSRWVFKSELQRMGLDPDSLRSRDISTRNGKAKQYRVENDDPFSLVNTILKMAKKRALVDAALSAARLSDIFTQDIEDAPVAAVADVPDADQETGEIAPPAGLRNMGDVMTRLVSEFKVNSADVVRYCREAKPDVDPPIKNLQDAAEHFSPQEVYELVRAQRA